MTRQVDVIVRAEIQDPNGTVEVVEGTPIHPIWSIDRNDWVALGDLEEGEHLHSLDGLATVVAISVLQMAVTVYNVEVHSEHVYEVCTFGVLAHNAYATEAAEEAARGLWNLTDDGASVVMRNNKFGKFFKSKSDDLWWAVDNAGHGESAFKVFKETGKGLEWFRDADRFGDFIVGKHKGPTGMFIPWKQMLGV